MLDSPTTPSQEVATDNMNISREDKLNETLRKCVAAGGASVLSALVTTPLDVVKHRMQAQHASGMRRVPEATALQRLAVVGCPTVCPRIGNQTFPPLCAPECLVYLSTIDGLRKIVRHEGLNALWRGVREGIIMSVPMVGIYMPLYDSMVGQLGGLGHYAPVVAGSTSRAISLFFVAPLDILRIRTQVTTGMMTKDDHKTSSRHISDWRGFDWGQNKGLIGRTRALWRGYGATVARDVPFSGMYWGMLEPIRQNMLANCAGEEPTMLEVLSANAVAGSVSGTIAAGLTTPLDVVKTRQQIVSGGKSPPMSFLATFLDITRKEGYPGLLSGLGPRCFRAAPACAIVLSTYEILKRML